MKSSILNFFVRQKASPFEAMFGFYCIYRGISGLFDFGIVLTNFSQIIGPRFAEIIDIISIVAGTGVFFGLGLQKGNLEAFGLAILTTLLIVRTIIFGWIFGLNPEVINTYVLNAVFVLSSVGRMYDIITINKKLTKENHIALIKQLQT